MTAWRESHTDALRAFPELDAKFKDAAQFSETLVEVAAARRAALDDAQVGTLGRLVGVEDPAEVVQAIGSIFGRQDAPAQMTRLRQTIGGNEAAKNGLRKAVLDVAVKRLIATTQAAPRGTGQLPGDTFQAFAKQNGATLKAAGFTDGEINLMGAIADDLQQANRSLSTIKAPWQFNLTRDIANCDLPTSMLKIAATALAGGGAAGIYAGGAAGATAAGIATLLAVIRENGIRTIDDLVTEALLDPAKARMLLTRLKPVQVKSAAEQLNQRFRRGVLASMAAGEEE